MDIMYYKSSSMNKMYKMVISNIELDVMASTIYKMQCYILERIFLSIVTCRRKIKRDS